MKPEILRIKSPDGYMEHATSETKAVPIHLIRQGYAVLVSDYEKAWHSFWWHRLDVPSLAQADARVFGFLAEHLKCPS